jgi:hypothetical protein
LQATKQFSFGLFILTPDDVIVSRKEKQLSSRDNVIFELGMFLGALGKDRVFAVAQENLDGSGMIKIPSDLFGVHVGRFSIDDLNHNVGSIGSVLVPIKLKIRDLGHVPLRLKVGYEFDPRTQLARVEIDPDAILKNRGRIGNASLLLVVRKRDEDTPAHIDPNIIIGPLRPLDSQREPSIIIKAGGRPGCLGEIPPETCLDFSIFLVPSNANISECKTIEELRKAGCFAIDHFGLSTTDPNGQR